MKATILAVLLLCGGCSGLDVSHADFARVEGDLTTLADALTQHAQDHIASVDTQARADSKLVAELATKAAIAVGMLRKLHNHDNEPDPNGQK